MADFFLPIILPLQMHIKANNNRITYLIKSICFYRPGTPQVIFCPNFSYGIYLAPNFVIVEYWLRKYKEPYVQWEQLITCYLKYGRCRLSYFRYSNKTETIAI